MLRLGPYFVHETQKGGMGEIFFCSTQEDEPPFFAFKTFKKEYFFDRDVRLAFVREIALWARLSSQPFVMPILGLEIFEGRPFAIMPNVATGHEPASLRGLLRMGKMPPERSFAIATQVALSLFKCAERIEGFVHGDLKPDNILLWHEAAFVSDFGLARVAGERQLDLESTWAYMAPENWSDPQAQTVASDIYAYGMMVLEMVASRYPVEANTREEWRRAHLEASPSVNLTGEPSLIADLGALALRCVAKRAGDRPHSFEEIFKECLRMGLVYSFDGTLGILEMGARLNRELQQRMQLQLPHLIRTLLFVDAERIALEELEQVPTEQYDADLWALRGSVLSLNGRDSEALPCFERALQGDLSESRRHETMCELGLSLKRLDRYQEAIELYDSLLGKVSDNLLPNVIVNMAMSCLESGETQRAIHLLEGFTRKHPQEERAFGALGQAYARTGRFAEAAHAFRSAIAVGPHFLSAYLELAKVLMEELGSLEEAWVALDMAFDQGHLSAEWFVRFFACSMLLGRMDVVEGLGQAAERDLGPEKSRDLLGEALKLVRLILERSERGGNGPPLVPETAREERAAQGPGLLAEFMSAIRGSFGQRQSRGDGEAGARESDSQSPDFTTPFLNIRIQMSEGVYSIDFYDDTGSDTYVEHFLLQWREITRRQSHQDMRSTPLYFTRCAGCSFLILTNRDVGSRLSCRSCGTRHETRPEQSPELEALLSRVNEALGKKPVTAGAELVVLLLQPPNDEQWEMLEAILRDVGFSRALIDTPMTIAMKNEGVARGLLILDRPIRFYTKKLEESRPRHGGDTPPEVEEALFRLRHQASGLRTMSASIPVSTDLGSLLMQGRLEEAEAVIRKKLEDNPADLPLLDLLVHVLMQCGKLDEALSIAERLTRMAEDDATVWQTLGMVEQARQRHPEAIVALKRALELDPLRRAAMVNLIACYRSVGDENLAGEMTLRLRNLGVFKPQLK